MIRSWIEQAARRRGDDIYLADARGPATLTYARLLDIVRAAERRLDGAGLARGARIAVGGRGTGISEPLDYAAALMAIVAAGRVAVPLDPGAPAADVARVLAVARPEAQLSGVSEAKGQFGITEFIFDPIEPRPQRSPPEPRPQRGGSAPFAVPPAGGQWGGGAPAMPGGAGGSPPRGKHRPPAGNTAGIFLCTSGTTGTPKGIFLREEQLAHVASSIAGCHRLTRADRGYCPLPLFHVNAEVVGLLATLRAGAYLAVDRKFSRGGFWDMIGRHRITWINAVPAIISILGMDPPAARPAGLRFVRSASAPLPLAALERFEHALGVPVVETYGMTEAASMITANPPGWLRRPGSAGRPAGAEVRIDRGGAAAAPGEIGRVRIRGAGVITGYDSGGRPGAIDADGWLDTGDLGYLDSDGFLFLAGRSDDVINRGGEKIYPREIEEILLSHPGVRSAAVIGVADDILGERPVACIVSGGDFAPGEIEAALAASCAARLPRHKQPSAYCLVGEMPLGPTGKISRRLLKVPVAARP